MSYCDVAITYFLSVGFLFTLFIIFFHLTLSFLSFFSLYSLTVFSFSHPYLVSTPILCFQFNIYSYHTLHLIGTITKTKSKSKEQLLFWTDELDVQHW